MKSAIITGASGNLGQALVNEFLQNDWQVTGTVIPHDTVKIDIENIFFDTQTVDLMDEEAAREFVENLMAKDGEIDALVCTVGGFAMGNIQNTSTTDIEKQWRLNFATTYNIVRPVFKQMMQQERGRIFLIGSKPGLDMRNGKGMIAYSLSKSLIFRLAELLNEEAKGKNIVTSVVVPSTIDTPQNRQSMPKADYSTWVQPQDIAKVIFYHCTDAAAILREPLIKVYHNA